MEENNNVLTDRKTKLKFLLSSWIKKDSNKLFLLILVLAFIVRLWIFFKTMNQPIWWDEADYLSAAKRWAGINPNVIDIWYYRRGLFWPLFNSLFFIFGIDEIGIRIALVLFSTGIVFVSYLLIKEMFDKKLATLVGICLTFSWIFMFFTGRTLSNLPSTFFLLTSLFFFYKGYVLQKGNKFIYLFGLFFALTCLTRMQYLLSAIPMIIFAFIKERHRFLLNKQLWIAIGIFAVIFIPQFYMHWQHFGNPVTDLAKFYLGVGSSQTGEVGVKLAKTSDLFLYFNNLPYILDANQKGYYTLFAFSPLYFIFIFGFLLFFFDTIIGFDKIFNNLEIQKRFFILSWISISFLFMGYIAPHLEQRYIMETLPFLFLIAVYPYILLEKFFAGKFKIREGTFLWTISFLLILILIPNIIFGNNLTELKKTSNFEVKDAGLWIKQNSNPDDIIMSDSLPQLTYYSERSVYPFNLAPRRDSVRHNNESDFMDFVETNKPKYMTLTAFERQEDWVFALPQKYPELIVPVQVYKQNEQPVFVVYEFKYD
ncbi:glycosyltransferase family 39 protein [Candidatus Pacearchaeota archaeon]|nr:glycosyltransferase family 39 protein [Candidatus Pacearchaeota archaeon]